MKCHEQQRGIILLSTMMIIALLSLVLLSQMHRIFIAHKLMNQLIEKHRFFSQFETTANLALSSACETKERDPNDIILLLKNKQGCMLTQNEQQFYYLTEDLGLFPCLQILGNSSKHLRITIMATGKYPAILQMRMAKSAMVVTCKNQEVTRISSGLLSWRYLSA